MLGLGTLAKKVFGTPNDRKVKATRPLIEKINALEPEFEALSDEGLVAKTAELRDRATSGEDLNSLLPEAFANCREAAKRALGLRAFDVQLMGGIFLHQGNISEMRTGEGKTLVATFPAYLNALTGRSVHVVTVNDYLAKRDAEWGAGATMLKGMQHSLKVAAELKDLINIEWGGDTAEPHDDSFGLQVDHDQLQAQSLNPEHFR